MVRASLHEREIRRAIGLPEEGEVTVEGVDLEGEPVTMELEPPASRVVQHELDHLDGKLYIDYLDSMDELMAVGPSNEDDEEVREATSALA